MPLLSVKDPMSYNIEHKNWNDKECGIKLLF